MVYKGKGRNCLEQVRDEALAGLAASGNMEAFEELVNRHRMPVYRLARSITGSHDDADDAAQETFLRVYRALNTYDPKRPFKPWLKKIATSAPSSGTAKIITTPTPMRTSTRSRSFQSHARAPHRSGTGLRSRMR